MMDRVTVPITMSRDLYQMLSQRADKNSISATIIELLEQGLRTAEVEHNKAPSSQNTATGRAAAQRGKRRAEQIAKLFGGDRISTTSNLFEIDGKRTLIKSSSQTNSRYGVYEKQLSEIDEILFAAQIDDETFELYALSPKIWEENAFDISPNNRNYKLQRQMSGSQVRRLGEERGEVILKD